MVIAALEDAGVVVVGGAAGEFGEGSGGDGEFGGTRRLVGW